MFGLSPIWLTIAKYAAIALACISLGAWGATKIENGRVDAAKAETAMALAHLQTARNNVASVLSGLHTCNASVEALQKASQDATARAQKAVADAQASRTLATKEAARVAAMKPRADLCHSASALIRETVK